MMLLQLDAFVLVVVVLRLALAIVCFLSFCWVGPEVDLHCWRKTFTSSSRSCPMAESGFLVDSFLLASSVIETEFCTCVMLTASHRAVSSSVIPHHDVRFKMVAVMHLRIFVCCDFAF